jgi:uncharacterized repeat protein (TIGR03847 family)
MEARMANVIELNPVDFVTIGTIGPKGQRTFHLQAGQANRLISFTIEKEQAWALSEAIKELLDDIDERDNTTTEADFSKFDMDLREPIEPMFRVAQMGLAYEANDNMVILIAQEFTPPDDDDDEDDLSFLDDDDDNLSFLNDDDVEPNIVRMWCTREQIHALSLHAIDTVKSGRPDAKQNGRIIYYWT